MRLISMADKDWYAEAMTALVGERELTIQVRGATAAGLRKHLATMSEQSRRAGWLNIFYMLRYRRFHRVFYSALALGLGVEMEDAENGQLLVRLNEKVGQQPPRPGVALIHTARRPEPASS